MLDSSNGSGKKIHLRYIRLPDNIMESQDDLLYRSKEVIVGRSQISSQHSVEFDGEIVLAAGYSATYFELMGRWFSVGKIRDLRGRHTGYYCDIVTPFRVLVDGVELTDLFLDLWVSPDLRYKVLDEEELEDALTKGRITKELFDKARRELKKLVAEVENGRFPPRPVRQLETKLKF